MKSKQFNKKIRSGLRTFYAAFWRISLVLVASSLLLVILFRWIPVPASSFILQDRFNSWWFHQPKRVYYQWVAWHQMSSQLALAVVAAEDQKFPGHAGFDVESINDAVSDRLRGGKLRGASTISQQVAKNMFLWRGQSLARKAIEAYFTILVELFWSKQRILEVYLNTVELGSGIYGVGAASRIYFNKSAKAIEIHEAALLAAVLPNPKRMRVQSPSHYVLLRQVQIIQQMQMLGLDYIKEPLSKSVRKF